MALQLSGDIAGLGKIVQIVRATDSTFRSTTSTSFTDVTGMSVSITPNKSNSQIYVLSSFCAQVMGTNAEAAYQLTDSSNAALSGAESTYLGGGTNPLTLGFLLGVDAPNTTSSVTYKLRFRTLNATWTARLRNEESTGQLFAIEVAA